MNSLRALLRRLLPGDLGREVARGAGVVFLIQVGGAGLSYASHIVLARILDPAGYGVYAFVMAWVALLAIPASLGLGTALVRFISQYREQGSPGLLRGAAIRSWQMVMGTGILIALAASAVILGFGERFDIPYGRALLIGVWIVPLRALIDVQVAMSRGLKAMKLAFVPGQIGRPLLLVGGIAVILALGLTVDEHVAVALAGGAFLVVVLSQGTMLGRRILTLTSGSSPRFRSKQWLRTSLPMLLIAGFLLLLKRTDVVMLGLLAGAEDVGTYNAAARTANLASFVLIAVNAIAAPSIAALYHRGETEQLQDLANSVAHLIFWPSLVVVVALVALAPIILGLFGQEFVAGETVLAVLAAGHLVNVGVGSVGYFMNMTGNQDEMARVVGVAAVLNIGLNALAIPLYGALGAAVATALSMAGWNVWVNRLVVARLSIRPSIVHAVLRLIRGGP